MPRWWRHAPQGERGWPLGAQRSSRQPARGAAAAGPGRPAQQGQAKALTNKLQNALDMIEGGQTNAATGMLNGLLSQLSDFVDAGVLTFEQAASITVLVEAVLAGL